MKDEEILQILIDQKSKEIELFWKRSNFYWLVVAAAFVAYAGLKKDFPDYCFIIATFGFISSLTWLVGNAGSKWWIMSWEKKLNEKATSMGLDIFDRHSSDEFGKAKWYLPCANYSVTKITITLSAYVNYMWILIFIFEGLNLAGFKIEGFVIYLASSFLTVFFAILILVTAKTKNDNKAAEEMPRGSAPQHSSP